MDPSVMQALHAPTTTSSSITAGATSIVVPSHPDVNDSAVSPAITTTGTQPTVSPVVTSSMFSMPATETTKLKVTTKTQAGMNGGRWTEQEHQSFLAGLRLYGREWKKVASKIKTRTSAQIRSHAQKYFAKLARDDETRKQGGLLQHLQHGGNGGDGLDAGASSYGYMSDGGSSATNLSGDEGADTDSNSSQRSSGAPTPGSTGPSMLGLPSLATQSTLAPKPSSTTTRPSLSALALSLGATNKKRSRSMSSNEPSPSSTGTSTKLRRIDTDIVSTIDRLPSPEEMLEKVSPPVRQRLASLIEAEMSALQVLSCYAWLQQQQDTTPRHPQQQHHLHSHHHHHFRHSHLMGVGSSSPSGFPASSGMSLTAMITTERTPSIY